jgi:signal transduction histidine kinase
VAAAVGIAALHRHNQRGFLAQMDQALPMSVSLSAQTLGDWIAVRATHTRLLATAVSNTPAPLTNTGLVQPLLEAMIAEGGFASGRLEAPDSIATLSPLRTLPRTGSVNVAQFRAPVIRNNQTVGTVLLELGISEAAFPHFNAAAPDDRTQRTALLLGPAATLAPNVLRGSRTPVVELLAASEAGGNTPAPAAVSVPASLQPFVARGTLARSVYATIVTRDAPAHGIGPGLTGRTVVYATTPVPGTPWVLVRERETAELLALIQPSLLVTDVILGVLTLLIIGVVLLWWRTQYQHRETETERLRATFVAGVSHELRTPLTQVRMYAEMLRLELLSQPDERARALSVIEKETERLALLIDRTLAFVRTGQPAEPLPRDAVNLADGVRRALDAVGALAAERRVHWDVQVNESLTVRCARDDLQQVLLNLLDNAIKYGPPEQTVTIAAQHIGTHHDTVQLTVRDEGPGVHAAEAEAIWQPFRRGRAASESDAAGTGIGLAVVRELVQRSGGHVVVQSPATGATHQTAGATFVVELPAAV